MYIRITQQISIYSKLVTCSLRMLNIVHSTCTMSGAVRTNLVRSLLDPSSLMAQQRDSYSCSLDVFAKWVSKYLGDTQRCGIDVLAAEAASRLPTGHSR